MPRKGGSTARGYGYRHQQLRDRIKPTVLAGRAVCWRCGEPIKPTDKWDLGHHDEDRSRYMGPEHAGRCNRAAAARKGHRNRRAATAPAVDTSRAW